MPTFEYQESEDGPVLTKKEDGTILSITYFGLYIQVGSRLEYINDRGSNADTKHVSGVVTDIPSNRGGWTVLVERDGFVKTVGLNSIQNSTN